MYKEKNKKINFYCKGIEYYTYYTPIIYINRLLMII